MTAVGHASRCETMARVLQLADELRANVSYAVLVGLLLSALLGGLAMFTDATRPLPLLLSAVVVYGGLHLLLSVFMILKCADRCSCSCEDGPTRI